MTRGRHVGTIIISVLGVVSIGHLVSKPTPVGPWVGIYDIYSFVWLCVIGILLTTAIIVSRDQSVAAALFGSIVAFSVAIAITRQWGVPYGIRDPWTHLYYIHTGQYVGTNPYPALHLLVKTAAITAGINEQLMLAVTPWIAGILGIFVITGITQRLELTDREKSITILLSVPAFLSAHVAHPYTLALPFIGLTVYTLIDYPNQSRLLVILVLSTSIIIHPLISVVCAIFLVTYQFDPNNRLVDIKYVASIFIILFIWYFILITNVGTNILSALFVVREMAGGTSSQTPLLVRILNNFVETLARTSYSLLLGALVAIAVGGMLRYKDSRFTVIASVIVAAGTIAIFIGVTFAGLSFGIQRLTVIMPLVLLPAAALGVQTLTAHTSTKYTPMVLILLVVLIAGVGVMTALPGETTGAFSQTTVESDIISHDWLAEYASDRHIIGTSATPWIARGRYGVKQMRIWTKGRGTSAWYERSAYSWQVNTKSTVLIVVSDRDRYRARVEQEPPLRSLATFQVQADKVYASSNIRIYEQKDSVP